jgi:hypothetical protein
VIEISMEGRGMPGKKVTAKSNANGRSNGHGSKTIAGSALAQAPKKAEGSRRAQPTADELGRLAWETTYRNRQKSRRA